MTLDDVLREHRLDVAGLELWSRDKQIKNLEGNFRKALKTARVDALRKAAQWISDTTVFAVERISAEYRSELVRGLKALADAEAL